MKILMTKEDIKRTLARLAHQVIERHVNDLENVCFLGIQRRGVFLAARIRNTIENLEHIQLPLGILDITLYRDDLTAIGSSPVVHRTEIDFDIEGKNIILVDDVLFTGRTVRAALDEIIDFGRPKKVELLILVDRGHRELPIRPDYVGKNIPTSRQDCVEVKLEELDGEDLVRVYNKNEVNS